MGSDSSDITAHLLAVNFFRQLAGRDQMESGSLLPSDRQNVVPRAFQNKSVPAKVWMTPAAGEAAWNRPQPLGILNGC